MNFGILRPLVWSVSWREMKEGESARSELWIREEWDDKETINVYRVITWKWVIEREENSRQRIECDGKIKTNKTWFCLAGEKESDHWPNRERERERRYHNWRSGINLLFPDWEQDEKKAILWNGLWEKLLKRFLLCDCSIDEEKANETSGERSA